MDKLIRKITKLLIPVLFLFLAFLPNHFAKAESNASYEQNIQQLLELQPELTESELLESLAIGAEETGMSEEELAQLAVQELEAVIANENTTTTKGNTNAQPYATLYLKNGNNKGDIFHTSSSTLGIDHGHVGIYYTTSQVVESIPSTGVRTVSVGSRVIESGTVLMTVSTTTANRNAAANWAASRAGVDGYSYNFATNRLTAHTGDKNCSKLVWSAYQLNGGLDIDSNGGTGVYPNDIKNSSLTSTYKTIS